MKKKNWIFLAIGAAVLIAAVILCLTMCGPQSPNTDPSDVTGGADTVYTVTVNDDTGKALEGVGVYIYIGSAEGELVWYDTTGADGTMTFTAPARDDMVAVLDSIPTGLAAEASYPISGESTLIVLSMGVLSAEDMENTVYKLGDKMLDFTVTDTDGVSYTLSELLGTKKAVVLNFWYIGCDPCASEFPYMQQAYALYGEDIEILAMNPVDRSESEVAAYKTENGLTFPMIVADEQWAKLMNLAAYPTTVIIDSSGCISLIHKGAIENFETFEQLFGHFTSDDYEAGSTVDGIEDVLVTSDVGTKTNPLTTDAAEPFEITVNPGATYCINIYKQSEKFYLTVKGGDFTVTHKNKTYTSDGGSRTLTIQPEGVFIPVVIEITNTTDKVMTYTISKSSPAGSYSNPYTLKLGEFTAKIPAGNDQGIYYSYTMPSDGTLTIKCLSATSGVEYDYTLYNLDSYSQYTLEGSGKTDSAGKRYLEIQGRKGQKIQFILNTMPDDTNNYPAGTFKLLATMDEGEVKEPYKLPQTTYTVKVVDGDGAPMSGVSMSLVGSFTHVPPEGADEEGKTYPISISATLMTGADGTAVTTQTSGPYTITVVLPEGYRAAVTSYELTADQPTVTVTLQKIIQLNYTVTLCYPDGTPVSGAAIMLGTAYKSTDETGSVSFHLDEGSYSFTVVTAPEGYALPGNASTFTFPEGESTVTLTLVGVGGLENPYLVSELPWTTKSLAAGEKIYLSLTADIHYEDAPTLTVSDPGAVISYNGQDYTADPESGLIEIALIAADQAPMLAITNTAEESKSFELAVTYPVGTQWNPQVIDSLDDLVLTAPEGDADGYYYQFVHENGGTLTLALGTVTPADAGCTVELTTETSGTVELTAEGASVYQKIDEPTLIHITAHPTGEEPEVSYPAVSAAVSGSFEIDWTAVPEGKRTYSVTVLMPNGNPMTDVMVQFWKNGEMVAFAANDSTGTAKAILDTGVYNVELALPETTTKYYYDVGGNSFALGVYDMTIKLVTKVAGSATSTITGNSDIGKAIPVSLATTSSTTITYYVTQQADTWKYFVFTAKKAGVYRLSVSDPNAMLCYCGTSYYCWLASAEEASSSYEFSLQSDQYKNSKIVFAISGADDTMLTITRLGDPAFNPAYVDPDYSWYSGYTPVATDVPTSVSRPTYVDIMDQTAGKYVPVYNEDDQFYHMGSKDGPIIYMSFNDTCPYASVKVAVVGSEGSAAGGTSFGRYFFDSSSGAFIKREEYGTCIRQYVQMFRDNGIADGKRFYPLNEDLAYILRIGCAEWWEDSNNMLSEDFAGYNPDIVWLFACCTFG